jgi:hypothetical protein
MMTIQSFQHQRFDVLLRATQKAVYLTSREEGKFIIFLYQLEVDYIEVYFHKKYSYIYGIRAFAETEELQPYLSQIPIHLYQ